MSNKAETTNYSSELGSRTTMWFVVSIIITLVLFGLLGWNLFFSYNLINTFKKQEMAIGRSSLETLRYAGMMDEATRLTAISGNLKWKKEYDRAKTELDQSLEKIAQLSSSERVERMAQKIDQPRKRLHDIAQEVYELVRQGRKDEAFKLVSGWEYTKNRVEFERATKSLADLIRQRIVRKTDVQGKQSHVIAAVMSVSLVLLVLSWYLTARCWRNQTEEKRRKLRYRLEFEERISSVARRLISVSADEFDRGVDQLLESIGDFVGAGRAYVFQYHDDKEFVSNTHEWSAEGVSPQIDNLQNLRVENLPWWTKKLENFDSIHVRSLEELPPEAEKERRILEEQNICSLIAVPLGYKEELVGFIGFDAIGEETEWSSDTVTLLQTTGEILIQAIQRRKTERELEQSEEKYRRIFDLSPEAIVLLDTDGSVLEVNDRLDDWLGYKPDELKGKRLWELPYLPPESKDKIRTKFADRMAGKNPEPYELEFTSKSGETAIGLVHATPLTDQEDNIYADLVLIADITKRKRAEENLQVAYTQLKETQARLVDQERRQALTQMASGIAHDFNNALSTIRGFTDLLLQDEEKLQDAETAVGYLEHVRKAASNAAETVRRMRKFYRPQNEQKLVPIDLNSVVEEALSMTQPRWKEQAQARGANIEVEKDLDDIDRVRGDEAELNEMLTNLIFNAVDAMPEGGVLRLSTWEDGDNVAVEVEDTGTGMSEEEREHCLEPFYTTKQKTGTGLGLSTVSGIVERHEGQIEVRSKAGEGTTVRIVLPAAERIEAEETEQTEQTEEDSQSLKILVVEDEPQQRELMEEYLRMDDHQVNTAPDGQKGLTRFMDGYYDLVITDRSMPELNGDQLAREIKKEAPEKPVIMLTGFGDMMDAAQEEVEGVDLVLSKPVTLDKLREGVADLMPGQAGN